MKDNKWMVYIQCSTFNHAPYITDAMNGFTMQQTDFPFVCAIVDDASTDGEPEVIRKYLQDNFDLEDKSVVHNEETDDYVLCFAQHKTNKNCFFTVLLLKYNHYSIKKSKEQYYSEWVNNAKYIAICEGDDYWIDRFKLSQQVQFLESHPDYVMHFHNAIVRFQDQNRSDGLISNFQSGEFCTQLLFEKWQLPTASLMFRRDIYNNPVYLNRPKGYPGDITLFYTLPKIGKVYGLSQCMSVYRKHDGGMSNNFSTGEWTRLQYGIAYEIGDKGAIRHCRKLLVRCLRDSFFMFLRGNEEAREIYRNAYNLDKSLILSAIPRICIYAPYRIISKIINPF